MMSIGHLQSSIIGFPLRSSPNSGENGCSAYRFQRNQRTKVFSIGAPVVSESRERYGRIGFRRVFFHRTMSRFGEGLAPLSSPLKNQFRLDCFRDPFGRSRNVIMSFFPIWKEGLLFFRCSVFATVISAMAIMVWYAQTRARAYIEARLLPSVSLTLSDYLQREVNLGKVKLVSPLSVSLHSCSVGPHSDEFSCGEMPSIKLRIHPFASLRKGKFVVDAILSRPNILISQKEDFSWLGIPAPSENGFQRHRSDEEGLDYRTKVRRISREEAAAKWAQERVLAAKKAAELGYVLSQPDDSMVLCPDTDNNLNGKFSYGGQAWDPVSFYKVAGRMGTKDHQCMEDGSFDYRYGLKHLDLEKSFGIKYSPEGLRRSSVMPDSIRRRFRKKARKKCVSLENLVVQRRNLDRSAAAARAYFQRMASGKSSAGNSETATEEGIHSSVSYSDGSDNSNASGTGGFRSSVSYSDGSDNSNASGTGVTDIEQKSSVTPDLDSNNMIEKFELPRPATTSSEPDVVQNQPIDMDKFICSETFRRVPIYEPFFMAIRSLGRSDKSRNGLPLDKKREKFVSGVNTNLNSDKSSTNSVDRSAKETLAERSRSDAAMKSKAAPVTLESPTKTSQTMSISYLSQKFQLGFWSRATTSWVDHYLANCIEKSRTFLKINTEQLATEFADGLDEGYMGGIHNRLPVALDSVYFTGGTLMLLGYGDQEPREMENVQGHVKFQKHYGRAHVQLSGCCKEWRTGLSLSEGGWLLADVFVDSIEQNWHANLKIANLHVPLFERILEIPITWSKGRASGEVHICMSKGENFPNVHGQLDVNGLEFQILDATSSFSEVTASLCFRGQRIFLHNASGQYGDVSLEASGDFGINPDDGEFHLMCQVPCVEVNALMKTFKMKPFIFPLAGSVSAVFNCQGPLDAPVFVGSGMISRRTAHSIMNYPVSSASEAVLRNKDTGAVAAMDRIPFSYVSANFTYSTDSSIADLYGIRVSLLDGGEIRGAGNAWICPEGEMDDSAFDVDLSGKLNFDKVLDRYMPAEIKLMPLKLGYINGETKLSGSLLKPRLDIKWAAPDAEESFNEARGDIILSHECIAISSSSPAFDLIMKVRTAYPDDYLLKNNVSNMGSTITSVIEGVELDLRMRGFEFFNLVSPDPFDSPRPMHLKATGRVKFHGEVSQTILGDENASNLEKLPRQWASGLIGEISLSGIRLNQLMLAPQLVGSLKVSHESMKLDVTGRPDENFTVEIIGPLQPTKQENLQKGRIISASLQKGQLRANVCYVPQKSASLEIRHLPLDELELGSLRGSIQKAELQLNFQKRKGHGILSVIRPKFSGLQGEALDLSARWSGDVITIEKSVLEQAISRYELQGEYVLPGIRDRHAGAEEKDGLLKRAMAGNLGSVISSMGRWRMRLEVPCAEVAEMLPLARLLSRSSDPAVRSRSKDLFMRGLQSAGFLAESLREQLEAIRQQYVSLDEAILEDVSLPGLAELKGYWHGYLDAKGGGNGDSTADFDFHGQDWEWGTYKAQRVLAAGAYSNNDGLRLEKILIQRDDATIHADGTLLGPKTNLHFAVLNFPIDLVPTLLQVIESSTADPLHSSWALFTPVKGILHMEGDLRGSLRRPQCDVQVRLLDGAVGGIDLGRAEIVASITSESCFIFTANFEPAIQSGHVHIQGSVPLTSFQNEALDREETEGYTNNSKWAPGLMKETLKGANQDKLGDLMVGRNKTKEGWEAYLSESLSGLDWNILDVGDIQINADIKDGGMMLLTALCPHAHWLHGNADILLQVRGTVQQPIVDGSASFHRASVSSPVLPKPLANFGGTVQVKSNRLSINTLEGRVSRKGKLMVKGNLPLKTSELLPGDKIDLKCEVLEVRAKNIFSGQVDSQMQITGSIMQPNVSGMIKLSHGEAYLPHDKGTGAAINRLASNRSSFGGKSLQAASGNFSHFFGTEPAAPLTKLSQSSGRDAKVEKKLESPIASPIVDARLSDLKLHLGPELRIVYPLIMNFAVSGELELNGLADPRDIKPKGILTFENGEVNLFATQLRIKRDHPNIAKFEPDLGIDPTLDLALVGSEWQLRIQSRASNWQDNLVVTSTRSVEQDVLSPTEAARVFESQLKELLERDGQLAFKKLAAATLKTLMPRIEGKGQFGQARWRLVSAPQFPSSLPLDPTVDPLKSLANISFGTEVEIQLGKRLQASVVRQMNESEMAMQWTLLYQLTSRLRILFQSAPSTRLLFEYTATSQN
ncbi:uncharacterized protein LOC18434256 [Amborella trichopoda]|uniref:Translocation and assembly module TamB C-terminal domain-containing protein n=1 Tax=Amborella trichopoda TaxID=13333 RepID=W1PDN3_AMBTC|nr:uncharacterized protein LOC18434256 [Amborella trichopoda]ERN06068.1 hypothetical protein AMTR_s00142p00090900 [Amborella trichopoda]|eukprot:XP_006844393.1 uncharacterized protein LOC18434256 [Amborella trichopoda]